MSGTLPSLSLAQFNDENGRPESGAKLYLYEAATSTPVDAFKDSALTVGQEHPWPLEADSYGLFPAFWLDDGSYRARMTTSGGVVRFDVPSIDVVGSSGGGGSITVISTFETGDVDWQPRSGARTGWVRHNGRTIGSASSGATERANADVEALFTTLWNRHSNTICPVLTGRGANAAADWAANKQLTLLDLRGAAPLGLDDMGNSAASKFTGITFAVGDATTPGSSGGASRATLVAANLPAYTPAGTVAITDPGHVHNVDERLGDLGAGAVEVATGFSTPQATMPTASATTDITAAFTGTAQGGTSTPVDKLPPFSLGSWYVRI